jgi:hypothetical protein
MPNMDRIAVFTMAAKVDDDMLQFSRRELAKLKAR